MHKNYLTLPQFTREPQPPITIMSIRTVLLRSPSYMQTARANNTIKRLTLIEQSSSSSIHKMCHSQIAHCRPSDQQNTPASLGHAHDYTCKRFPPNTNEKKQQMWSSLPVRPVFAQRTIAPKTTHGHGTSAFRIIIMCINATDLIFNSIFPTPFLAESDHYLMCHVCECTFGKGVRACDTHQQYLHSKQQRRECTASPDLKGLLCARTDRWKGQRFSHYLFVSGKE